MDDQRSSQRVVRLTSAARIDLAGIDNATAATWGEEQANRYLAFLSEVFAMIATEPMIGVAVDEFPHVRLYVAKYSRRRASYGHRIFYREVEDGIRIIRILHTAMNWPEILEE